MDFRSARLPLLFVTLLVSSAGDGFARTSFLTEDFVVNSHTTNSQFEPSVARSADGGFVIVWTSLEQENGPQVGAGVFARRYDGAANPLSAEFLVNTHTTNSQFTPAVAESGTGDFVVTWTSFGQADGDFGIFGQRFGAAAVPRGTEFRVDENTGTQLDSAIALAANGHALVVYRRFFAAGTGSNEIFGRFVDADGVPQGGEFQINTYTPDNQREPDVCATPSGEFVVVWQSGYSFENPNTQDGSGSGIFGQMLSSTGSPVGSEFQVNTITTYSQFLPKVACNEENEFIVAWGGYDSARPGASQGVFLRRFAANGTPTGSDTLVNPVTGAPRDVLIVKAPSPSIALDDSGGFVVVWDDFTQLPSEAGAGRVLGRSFTAAGTPRDTEFVVSSTTGILAYYPQIAGGSDEFVVTWTSAPLFEADPATSQDGDAFGVVARKFAVFPECGDANDSGVVTSTDALITLQTAVSTATCSVCVCDVNQSGGITSTDALALLQHAVGLGLPLSCDPC